MRDPPRHIAPGGHALRAHQIGHIVERHHIPFALARLVQPLGHAHQQVFLRPAPADANFLLRKAAGPVAQPVEQIGKFRHGHGNRHGLLIVLPIQKPFGRAVHEGHAATRIQPHHARRHRPQHAVEQPPPPLDLLGACQQVVSLTLQLPSHLVEIAAHHCDLVIAFFLAHLHVEIAVPDALRRTGQAPHGLCQPLGKPHAQPDRRQDQDHRESQIHQTEFKQHLPPFALALAIECGGFLRLIQKVENLAIHVAADIEKPVRDRLQRHQRAELVVHPVLDHDHVVFAGGLQLRGCGALEIKEIRVLAARADLARAIHDIGLAQPALDAALAVREDLADVAIVQKDRGALGGVDDRGQRAGIRDQVAAMLVLIGLGRGDRVADHAANSVGKPRLQPHVHAERGKDRHGHGRDQRHDGKDPGQPKVQPRTRRMPPPRGHHAQHALGNQGRHDDHIDQIREQNDPQHIGRGSLIQRPHHQIGHNRQNRADHEETDGGQIAKSAPTPEAQQLIPVCLACPRGHRLVPSGCGSYGRLPRNMGPHRGTAPFPPQICCPFTSTCGGVSREYPAR